jgi:hypothetical protein
MAAQPRMPEAGPLGRNLAANVDRLRQERNWSWQRLSAELEKAGRPIPPLGLARMMQAIRRTDVDEMMTVAAVLGVTIDDLLADPGTVKPGTDHAAGRAARDLTARIDQLLAASGDPEAAGALVGYVDRALRRVQVEVEELLAEATMTGDPSVIPSMRPRHRSLVPAASASG